MNKVIIKATVTVLPIGCFFEIIGGPSTCSTVGCVYFRTDDKIVKDQAGRPIYAIVVLGNKQTNRGEIWINEGCTRDVEILVE